jgi:hypothetical protein
VKPIFVATLAVACAILTGCGGGADWGWKRTDGQSARNDPVLRKQFEADKTSCVGETQQAGLTGATGGQGASAGTLRSMRDHEALEIVRTCMARKGYVIVPGMRTAETLDAEQTAAR